MKLTMDMWEPDRVIVRGRPEHNWMIRIPNLGCLCLWFHESVLPINNFWKVAIINNYATRGVSSYTCDLSLDDMNTAEHCEMAKVIALKWANQEIELLKQKT